MNSATLPRDTTTLQAMVLAQQAEIEHLKLVIAKLRRMHFGQRSEKIDEMLGQLELALEELETGKAERSNVSEAPTPEEVPGKPVRKPLTEHLPIETVTHAPEQNCCPDCGGHLKPLGEDVSEILDYVPASFRVIRHVRTRLACSRCDVIVQAPAASRPIPRGMVTARIHPEMGNHQCSIGRVFFGDNGKVDYNTYEAGASFVYYMIAFFGMDKTLDFYRSLSDTKDVNESFQSMFKKDRTTVERSTLADWVGQCSALLERLRQHVLNGEKLHADDTPVPVLTPGEGKTKTGRLWTYVRDDRPAGNETPPAVWFA